MNQGSPVSVAELLAAGHRPRPAEAVAILLELCGQIRRGAASAVPPPVAAGTVFLDAAGSVTTTGGAAVVDEQTTSLLGHLLLKLLEASEAGAGWNVPSRLSALAVRAAKALPGGGEALTVEKLASALRRFAPSDNRAAVRGLVERWKQHETETVEGTGARDPLPVQAARWRYGLPVRWRHALPARWRQALPLRRRKALPLNLVV